MSIFKLPDWINPHLYPNKKFKDLTTSEINDLKIRLSKFSPDQPTISVVIPAWNEENNIYRTLSSLAETISSYQVEIVVVNNNSSDGTQEVLDQLGVRNYFQIIQGTPHARQLGLENAKGKYFLCADADTFYPPQWVDLMSKPMIHQQNVVGVYGRYSFLPPEGQDRLGLWFYEQFTGVIIKLRQRKKEYLNVYGFNMGLITEVGKIAGGFHVKGERKFAGVVGSDYENEAEDGRMALNLMAKGKVFWVTNPKAKVFTSSRRLMDDGSIWQAFINRIKRQFGAIKGY